MKKLLFIILIAITFSFTSSHQRCLFYKKDLNGITHEFIVRCEGEKIPEVIRFVNL